jgi:hypothetical protein
MLRSYVVDAQLTETNRTALSVPSYSPVCGSLCAAGGDRDEVGGVDTSDSTLTVLELVERRFSAGRRHHHDGHGHKHGKREHVPRDAPSDQRPEQHPRHPASFPDGHELDQL